MTRLFFLISLTSSLCICQENPEYSRKLNFLTNANWSMKEGDESYQFGMRIPIYRKISAKIYFGYRPQDPKTLMGGVGIEFDVLYWHKTRFSAQTSLEKFRRYEYHPFDNDFWKNTFGFGLQYMHCRHLGLIAEYHLLGFSYGTRDDPSSQGIGNPSAFQAGNVKLGCVISF